MSAFKRYVLTKVTLHLHTEPFQIGSQSLLVVVSIFSKNTTKSPSSSNQHHDEDIYVMDPSNPVGDVLQFPYLIPSSLSILILPIYFSYLHRWNPSSIFIFSIRTV